MLDSFLGVVSQVWNDGLYGIGITELIVSVVILFTGIIIRGVFIARVFKWLEKLSDQTESEADDAVLETLEKPLGYLPITVALYVITLYLPLSGTPELVAQNIVKAAIAFTIFSTLSNSVQPIFGMFSATSLLTASMTMWLERAARVLIWVIGIGVILDIFGIQIGPLVAGLGLFSVAVALGAQDLFKNLIAGILIIGENRFQPGDRIEIEGELHGVVENIGFRSTLVRLFSTAPMLVPNKDLADFKVINHGAMQYRRISWTINVIYSTTQDQLAKICEEIEAFIKSSDQFAENPRQDSFVKTDEFGASSIDIRILCYTEPLNLTDFTKVKQSLIFETIKIVRANGSEFAYPSTSVYMENTEKNPEDYDVVQEESHTPQRIDPDSGGDD